jgi:hypothetical protein
MPSYKTKQALKRKGKHYPIPDLVKDLKGMRSGKDLSPHNKKEERIQVFVQVRGM